MLHPGRAVGVLLAILLTGCAGVPDKSRVSDWTSPEMASIPPIATPPSIVSSGIPTPAAERAPKTAPLPTTPEPEHLDTWMPLYRWCKNHGWDAPIRLKDNRIFELRTAEGTLTLTAWSQVARWQGVQVYLGFAPQIINGELYVNALDLRKSVQPLIAGAGAVTIQRPLIVVDPGHGGSDTGARSVGTGRAEKELTLDWARRLQSLLISRGWDVVLTRTNDLDVAISNRVALAERLSAAVYLSLHFNSAGTDLHIRGVETYCMTPVGAPSTVTRGFQDDRATAYPNNEHDGANLQLAWRVQRELLNINGVRDRGVRRARFLGVLKTQPRPAILIEGGYLSHPEEAQLIATPAHRQQLAEAVATALSALPLSPLASTQKTGRGSSAETEPHRAGL